MDKERPIILKKQKQSPANDAVKANGIGDSSPVPSKSTKSKQGNTTAKGPLVAQQLGKLIVKAIASKATAATAKRVIPLKTTEKVANHPAREKKQKESLANDAVEAKGIGDSSPVPSKSTKSKQGKTAAEGPVVTQ